MERPGLLEFAIYALVLTAAAGWIYALPPFTVEPGTRSAAIAPASAPVESGGPEAVAETGSITIVSASSAEAAPAAAQDPEEEANLDPRPNLLVVTARSLNMRSEPNAGSELVGSFPRGALLEPVETSGNWVLVRSVDDAATGWMYAGYLGAADSD